MKQIATSFHIVIVLTLRAILECNSVHASLKDSCINVQFPTAFNSLSSECRSTFELSNPTCHKASNSKPGLMDKCEDLQRQLENKNSDISLPEQEHSEKKRKPCSKEGIEENQLKEQLDKDSMECDHNGIESVDSQQYSKGDFRSDSEKEDETDKEEDKSDKEEDKSDRGDDKTDEKEDKSDTEEDISDRGEDKCDKEESMGECVSKDLKEPKEKKYKQTTLELYGAKGGSKKNDESKKSKPKKKLNLIKRHSDRDTQEYRDGYPDKVDDPNEKDNLKFYTGKIRCIPDGDYIDNIHTDWWGDYRRLEVHHGYIQWLFPIREAGMNWQAKPLQKHEAEAIKADPTAKKRVLTSYKMMLHFYGMELTDSDKGTLKRSDNWEECYENLNWSSHNYLRITRILKCLGELGFEHLKKPFLQFVLQEALEEKTLKNTLRSCRDYWVGTLKNDEDREKLYEYIEKMS